MAAEHAGHDPSSDGHPLAPGATSEIIRANLLVDDRPLFDEELCQTEAAADADTLWDCIEHWRCVAVVQSDRVGFTRIARRAAERDTGQPSPQDEPLAVTRAKAGI